MGNDVAEAIDRVLSPSSIKVHRSLCVKLMKLVDRILNIFSEIEAARPRCSSGIDALCSLNRAIEKSKLLIQYCSESSKLYLAMTGDVVRSRCERSRNLLEQSLSQIENMVPLTLAVKISQIIEDIRRTSFVFDSSEEEAGTVVRSLFHTNRPLSSSLEKSEIEALQFASLRLHITSSRALLIEKRSIKKLLDNVRDSDHPKKKILSYLLFLLKKYGQFMIQEHKENDCSVPNKSYEAEIKIECIQPDSIHSWENSSASIVSFGSSMNNLRLPMDFSNVSLGFSDNSYTSDSSLVKINDSYQCESYSGENGSKMKFLSKLNSLPWDFQRRVVEDVNNFLNNDDQAFHFVNSESFVEPVIGFLKDAYDLHDIECEKAGAQLLLAFVKENRNEIPGYLEEDTFSLLSSLLGSDQSDVTEEALAILEALSDDKYYKSIIASSHIQTPLLNILNSDFKKLHEPVIKILYNISSYINSVECIPKLIPYLYDSTLAKYIILIFKKLCGNEEARACLAGTSGSIASIAKLLENGDREDQEHAVAVLLSICSQYVQYCQLVIDEDVISALFDISSNGSDTGKLNAMELLRLLTDVGNRDVRDNSAPDIDECREETYESFKETKSSSKKIGFFARRMTIFTAKKKK